MVNEARSGLAQGRRASDPYPTVIFGLVRAWRRKQRSKRPFPAEWIPHLERRVPFYKRLPDDLGDRFRELLKLFVWEKHFIPAGGLEEVTEEMQVVIGASAVRLVLHLTPDHFDRLTEIVVYPGAYMHPDRRGVILGEAHTWGTVVLSWEDVLAGLANPCDGHDTATHEFAHVLDRDGGGFNGTPRLRATADYQVWAEVMSHHFLALQDGGQTERRVLRDYGATNEAEFFAVATESFFEKSRQMRDHTPDLYDVMRAFYGFDPATDDFCFGGERDAGS